MAWYGPSIISFSASESTRLTPVLFQPGVYSNVIVQSFKCVKDEVCQVQPETIPTERQDAHLGQFLL